MVVRKIFATNHDMGGAQAIALVLKRLASEGHSIIICELLNSPGFPVLRDSVTEKKLYELIDSNPNLIREIIEKEQPNAVLTGWSGEPDTTDKLSIAIANKLNIPTILIGDTWPYPKLANLSVMDDSAISLYKTLSRVCVVDEVAKNIFVESGFDSQKVAVTGNPALDSLAKIKMELPKYRIEMRRKFGLALDVLVIYYALTDELEDEAVHGPYYGLRAEKLVLEEFLSAVSLAKELGFRLEIIVRQKPSYRTEMICEVIAKYCPSAIFDNERFFDGLAPVLAADIVIGTYTTVLEKAALIGLPAISYVSGRSLESDPIVTNRVGITVPFYKEGELADFILNVAKAPIRAVEDFKKKINPASLPPDATGNVAKEILDICN